MDEAFRGAKGQFSERNVMPSLKMSLATKHCSVANVSCKQFLGGGSPEKNLEFSNSTDRSGLFVLSV